MADTTSILNALTELYKQKILDAGAYDTGALYNSVRIELTQDAQTAPDLTVWAEDYLKYVDEGTVYIEPRLITEAWVADPQFDVLYEELVSNWIDDKMDGLL